MMSTHARPLAAAAALLTSVVGCKRQPPPAAPAAPPMTVRDGGSAGARALERMKELAGNWLAGETPVTFELIAGGQVVIQRGGFYAVWHADGNHLAAAVFAYTGYHTRLSSTRITDAANGDLVVELAAGASGNVLAEDRLPRSLQLTIAAGNNTALQRWSFGDDLEALELALTRTDLVPPAPRPPTAPVGAPAPTPATPPAPTPAAPPGPTPTAPPGPALSRP